MAPQVGRRAAVPALSEHRNLRFLAVFLLYMAQGVPIGFFQLALPAWMASNGASAAEVGYVLSAALLPWSLKLVNGFLMDRFAFLPMGRRRGWLIGAQGAVILGQLALAAASPMPGDVAVLAAFALGIGIATTFQDVAVDGMAVDLIPEEERARANGFMFGGQALGISLGTFIAGFSLARYGIGVAAATVALLVAMLLTLILFVRERPGERLFPWSPGAPSEHSLAVHAGAWIPILKGVLKGVARAPSLLFMAGSFLGGSSLGIFYGLAPLMATSRLGWNEADLSSLTASGSLAGAVVGLFLVGSVADRIGARRTVILIAAAIAALALAMLALRGAWASPILFASFVVAYLVLDTGARIGFCAVAMRLCSSSVAASQFCLYVAVANLGLAAGSALLGTLDGLGGHLAMMGAIMTVNLAGAAFLIAARVGR